MNTIKITENYLIGKYHVSVAERDALTEGTLNEQETAGYWLYEASHNPIGEFTRMLKDNDILLSQNKFYADVNEFLMQVGK